MGVIIVGVARERRSTEQNETGLHRSYVGGGEKKVLYSKTI